jgi:hypothetical protein
MVVLKSKFFRIFLLLLAALFLRFVLLGYLEKENIWIKLFFVLLILGIGAIFVLRGTAKIIEETTEVLAQRTNLAGGLLQSFGTAFPDMILGIIAAMISLSLRENDYTRAINFAIIAAATTFGSNIYNIGHAAWCIFRQNLANQKNKIIAMMPFIRDAGELKPMNQHQIKPSLLELDTAIDVSTALTVLTAIVAVSMVLFGKIINPPKDMVGDLYQLISLVGVFIFILSVLILFYFRKNKKVEQQIAAISLEDNYYHDKSALVIWISLIVSGLAILFAAESMVQAIEVFCEITKLPFVVAGVIAGIIGCLGEIIVVHNFSVNPKGRIGDAVVGVAMDNIVTIMGASIVAIIGGIYLGGNALIMIFVVILSLNTVLIWQISKLKNYLLFD